MSKKLKIYAVTHDILGDVFWEVFRRGLLDAAARFDVDVEHLRPGKFSPEIQAGLIDGARHAPRMGLFRLFRMSSPLKAPSKPRSLTVSLSSA
ncbi:hypothetical protein LP421_04790 (plasmid) [Rhizobium sp. RCAM05350]|nr:hypothetical protein LP421_04790 [Rhizobium sp. RCAM05350]